MADPLIGQTGINSLLDEERNRLAVPSVSAIGIGGNIVATNEAASNLPLTPEDTQPIITPSPLTPEEARVTARGIASGSISARPEVRPAAQPVPQAPAVQQPPPPPPTPQEQQQEIQRRTQENAQAIFARQNVPELSTSASGVGRGVSGRSVAMLFGSNDPSVTRQDKDIISRVVEGQKVSGGR